jgi:hypothetical protein
MNCDITMLVKLWQNFFNPSYDNPDNPVLRPESLLTMSSGMHTDSVTFNFGNLYVMSLAQTSLLAFKSWYCPTPR